MQGGRKSISTKTWIPLASNESVWKSVAPPKSSMSTNNSSIDSTRLQQRLHSTLYMPTFQVLMSIAFMGEREAGIVWGLLGWPIGLNVTDCRKWGVSKRNEGLVLNLPIRLLISSWHFVGVFVLSKVDPKFLLQLVRINNYIQMWRSCIPRTPGPRVLNSRTTTGIFYSTLPVAVAYLYPIGNMVLVLEYQYSDYWRR